MDLNDAYRIGCRNSRKFHADHPPGPRFHHHPLCVAWVVLSSYTGDHKWGFVDSVAKWTEQEEKNEVHPRGVEPRTSGSSVRRSTN